MRLLKENIIQYLEKVDHVVLHLFECYKYYITLIHFTNVKTELYATKLWLKLEWNTNGWSVLSELFNNKTIQLLLLNLKDVISR